MDGNVASEKLNYRAPVCCLQTWYFNIMYFSHQLDTKNVFIFCLSNKLKKWDPKHLLVTDIISINTHFRVSNT